MAELFLPLSVPLEDFREGQAKDVTKTRDGEREAGNERSAVFHIKFKMMDEKTLQKKKGTTEIAKYTVNLS